MVTAIPRTLIIVGVVVTIGAARHSSISGLDKPGTQPEENETVLYLKRNGQLHEGWVAVQSEGHAIERYYIPKSGRRYKVLSGVVRGKYLGAISQRRLQALNGEFQINGNDAIPERTVVQIDESRALRIVVRVVMENKMPMGGIRLEICHVWGGQVVDVLGLIADEDGRVSVCLDDKEHYKVRMRWPYSPIRFESKCFAPKDLKIPEFTFTPEPPEKKCFVLRFVDAATGAACEDISGVEVVRAKGGFMVGAHKGQALLRLDGTQESLAVGEQIGLRLPWGASRKYLIVQSTIIVGEAATAIDVALKRCEDAVVEWAVERKGGHGVADDVVVHFKAVDGGKWTRASASQPATMNHGEYIITAFLYGYRLYKENVVVTPGKQRVPIKLIPADRTTVEVGADGNPDRIMARVVYPWSKSGSFEKRIVMEKGKSEVFYDSREGAGLVVYAREHPPVLVQLDKPPKPKYVVSVTKGTPVKIRIKRNDVIAKVPEDMYGRIRLVSVAPWRQVVGVSSDDVIFMRAGRYIPVVDLSTAKSGPDLVGKVVECEPITVAEDVEQLVVTPRRIVRFEEVLRPEDVETPTAWSAPQLLPTPAKGN